MSGNVSWGRGASPPGPSSSRATCTPEADGLPANGHRVCPAARAPRGRRSCHRALRIVRIGPARPDRDKVRVAGPHRVPTSREGVPAPGWAVSATGTSGPAGEGSRDSEKASPRGPSRGGGDALGRGPEAAGAEPLRAPPRRSCARGPRQLRRGPLGFRKQGAAPRRKSSRSGRGRRAHTHFLHSLARARARRRKTGAPTARSGTLLRSQTSFL